MNLLWSSYNECEAISAELLRQSGVYREALSNADKQIENLEKIKKEYATNKQDCEDQLATMETTIKGRDKEIRKLRAHRGILGTVGVVLVGVIVYLSIEK